MQSSKVINHKKMCKIIINEISYSPIMCQRTKRKPNSMGAYVDGFRNASEEMD